MTLTWGMMPTEGITTPLLVKYLQVQVATTCEYALSKRTFLYFKNFVLLRPKGNYTRLPIFEIKIGCTVPNNMKVA